MTRHTTNSTNGTRNSPISVNRQHQPPPRSRAATCTENRRRRPGDIMLGMRPHPELPPAATVLCAPPPPAPPDPATPTSATRTPASTSSADGTSPNSSSPTPSGNKTKHRRDHIPSPPSHNPRAAQQLPRSPDRARSSCASRNAAAFGVRIIRIDPNRPPGKLTCPACLLEMRRALGEQNALLAPEHERHQYRRRNQRLLNQVHRLGRRHAHPHRRRIPATT